MDKPEKLNKNSLDATYSFLETVFSKEQHIPKELIPLPFEEQHWWCIRNQNTIIGTVAAWNDNGVWHWGRLAVNANQRGLGLGKRLAITSFQDLFNDGIEEITIDARDITVTLLKSLGGRVTGETEAFYGIPITPMILKKQDFILAQGSKSH